MTLPRKKIRRIRAGLHHLQRRKLSQKRIRQIYGLCRQALSVNKEKYKKYWIKFREIEPDFNKKK